MESVKLNVENGKVQVYRRDKRGWFKAGWGFTIESVAAHFRKCGFKVIVE